MMNTHAWLSVYAALLLFVGCGDDSAPLDASPRVDASDAAMGDGGDDGGESDGSMDAGQDTGCAELDDGIDCTVDTCVDGVVEHTPDDSSCSNEDPVCDGSGRIVQDVGVCDPTAGCMPVTETLEDCTDPAPTASCTGSVSTGDLSFNDAVGICDATGESAACGQQSTLCETTTPTSCASGVLTQATATCDSVVGCGESLDTSDCEVRPARCEGPTHITYTPACADAESCMALGTENRVDCATPAVSCEGLIHTTWAATCDAVDGCGATPVIETDCGATAGRTCTSPTSFIQTSCTCDPVAGCACTDEFFACTMVCCT